MELRTLRYFLAAAREENMTRAAALLHVTQPTLSKALRGLEEELGKKLFTRHSFSIRLTEEGVLLRRRAADLMGMAEKIEEEFRSLENAGGTIYLGLAETCQVRHIARTLRDMERTCRNLHYHVTSGDTEQVTEKLDKGLLDFALLAEEPDGSKYEHLTLPGKDRWGLLMPADDPLAEKETVTFSDLTGRPLFCSEQALKADLPRWCGDRTERLDFRGFFRLAYNGSVFAREGLGCLLTLDRLINCGPESGLAFRPLEPPLVTAVSVIWRRRQRFTPLAAAFLSALRNYCRARTDGNGAHEEREE